MLHIVTETGTVPRVAANGYYALPNPVIPETGTRIPNSWSPVFVTAYPTQDRQLVVVSHLQVRPESVPVQVRRIGDGDPRQRHIDAITASIRLIEQCESITMSPNAWRALEAEKQSAIRTYYEVCTPFTPKEIIAAHRPPPDFLNLFGTSPFDE